MQLENDVVVNLHESVKFDWLIMLNQSMAITCRIISGTQNKEDFRRNIS